MNDEQDLLKKTFKSKETDSTRLGTESRDPSIQEIVQHYLPETEWLDESRGRCPCPGKHLHTTRSTKNDCFVFIGGTVPTVYCLHDKCRGEIERVNSDIRAAFNLFEPELDVDAMQMARLRAAKKHALEAKAKASLPEILKQYSWDYGCLYDASEKRFPFETQTDSFLSYMFKPEDVLWIGDPTDTGSPVNLGNFAGRDEWFNSPIPGRYTTASTYKPGSWSRANANVETTPYMIVEGDKILGEPNTDEERANNKNACGAIFRWLKEGCEFNLRAVVDSGNKSLHGWFDMPTMVKFEELKIVLPAMGCDRAMFKPSQPARLPGVLRENGRQQKLLYLK